MAPSETFLNTLYAAPANPDLWADVLASCMALVGADSGWVCALDRRDRYAGSGFVRNLETSVQDRYFAHYAGLDPFRHDLADVPDPGLGLWSDERFVAKPDLVRSEFYADFMTPIRVHSILIVRMFDDGQVTRSMHLNYDKRGDWTTSSGWHDLQAAFVHLKRAAGLSREFERLTAREAVLNAALETSSGCVILLDRRGRICFATQSGDALLRRGTLLAAHHGRIYAARPGDAAVLQDLLLRAVDGVQGRRSGGWMQMAAADQDASVTVTVAPLRLAPPSDDEPVAMVSLSKPMASVPAPDLVLMQRHGLTPAERRIALMLAAGSSPQQIAEDLSVSYNTVRNHLKQIYDKCGVRRQGELVAYLLRSGVIAQR